jgi:PhnB protein
MTNWIPDGWHNITPRLIAHDPLALVDFLKQAFDATGEFRPERPAQMRIGDSLVMVSGVGPRDPMPAFLYLYVPNADATYQRALKAGAESLEEPADTPYGDRRGTIKDPAGNIWQIATYSETGRGRPNAKGTRGRRSVSVQRRNRRQGRRTKN